MLFHTTLIPAYGRDYKSKAELQADLDAGKDFLTVGAGRSLPVDKPSLVALGYTSVFIRYAALRKVGGFNL